MSKNFKKFPVLTKKRLDFSRNMWYNIMVKDIHLLSNNDQLYALICSNIDKVSYSQTFKLLDEMKLNSLASMLKTKFNDSRSILEIKSLIKQEYDL